MFPERKLDRCAETVIESLVMRIEQMESELSWKQRRIDELESDVRIKQQRIENLENLNAALRSESPAIDEIKVFDSDTDPFEGGAVE